MSLETWDRQNAYLSAMGTVCGRINDELRKLHQLAVDFNKVGNEDIPQPPAIEETLRVTEALSRSVREMIVTEPTEKQVILVWPKDTAA